MHKRHYKGSTSIQAEVESPAPDHFPVNYFGITLAGWRVYPDWSAEGPMHRALYSIVTATDQFPQHFFFNINGKE